MWVSKDIEGVGWVEEGLGCKERGGREVGGPEQDKEGEVRDA
jgi:hypothetical protein